MTSVPQDLQAQHADLTDAVARGRLALAEVASLPPRELDAIYELAAQNLDTGRAEDAVDLLAGLVTLFPFSASYWRAYAIALHRCLDLDRARAAYDAALLLQPGHALSRCYRAEILLYLGRKQEARAELEALHDTVGGETGDRVAELLRLLDVLSDWTPTARPARPAPQPLSEEETFSLPDARRLPLTSGRFDAPPSEITDEERREITQTAHVFAAVAEPTDAGLWSAEPTAPGPLPQQAVITNTSVLPRAAQGEDATQPRLIAGSDTATALIPGRRGRRADGAVNSAGPAVGAGKDVAGPAPSTGSAADEVTQPADTAGLGEAHAAAEVEVTHAADGTDLGVPQPLRTAEVELTQPAAQPDSADEDAAHEEITQTAVALRRTGVPLIGAPTGGMLETPVRLGGASTDEDDHG